MSETGWIQDPGFWNNKKVEKLGEIADGKMNDSETKPIDDILHDFRVAVGQNCMGLFCETYGIGRLEWSAKSSIHLIELVASWLRSVEIMKETNN